MAKKEKPDGQTEKNPTQTPEKYDEQSSVCAGNYHSGRSDGRTVCICETRKYEL